MNRNLSKSECFYATVFFISTAIQQVLVNYYMSYYSKVVKNLFKVSKIINNLKYKRQILS